MERRLVTYRIVNEILPIKDADMIELALIDGWQCVVGKGQFKVGDVGIYFEVDSFLEIRDYYEFLRRTSLRKMNGEEGFKLRTVKFRGELSQGLLMPLGTAGITGNEPEEQLATLLGVTKYEPPIPACLGGSVIGLFPSFIPKTDQERVQNLVGKLWGTVIEYQDADGNTVIKEIPPAHKRKYEVSEKVDGSSCTIYQKDGSFGVCSRNLDLTENEDNSYWKVVYQHNLKEKLAGINVAIQGELAGEGIQGNPLKLRGQELFIFDIYDIDLRRYLNPEERKVFIETNIPTVKTVPIIARDFEVQDTLKELLEYVQGKSLLNPKYDREGLVFKEEGSTNSRFSFKGISNSYLLKVKD